MLQLSNQIQLGADICPGLLNIDLVFANSGLNLRYELLPMGRSLEGPCMTLFVGVQTHIDTLHRTSKCKATNQFANLQNDVCIRVPFINL